MTSPTPEGQRVADRINALRARRERFAAANMWAFAHATDCAIRAIEDEMRATAHGQGIVAGMRVEMYHRLWGPGTVLEAYQTSRWSEVARVQWDNGETTIGLANVLRPLPSPPTSGDTP